MRLTRDHHLRTVFVLDCGWGQPQKREVFIPSWVPPESLTLSTSGPWQMPEAEGLEPHFQRCSPWQLRFLTRMSRSTFGETEAFPWGPQNLSTRPGGGNAARVERNRATFRLCLPPPPIQPRCSAPGSASENKALRFQPKVKVRRERSPHPI